MTETKKQSLFDIGADFEALESLLQELDGDISDPAAAAAVDAWFSEFEKSLADKADSYIWLIKKWESERAVAKEESERMRKQAQVRDNRIDSLKKRMLDFMEFTRRTLIETSKGRKIAIQNNGGNQPIDWAPGVVDWVCSCATAGEVAIDPVKVIARDGVTVDTANAMRPFLRAVVSLDADKVRAHLASGGTLPFAALLPRGRSLRIR